MQLDGRRTFVKGYAMDPLLIHKLQTLCVVVADPSDDDETSEHLGIMWSIFADDDGQEEEKSPARKIYDYWLVMGSQRAAKV